LGAFLLCLISLMASHWPPVKQTQLLTDPNCRESHLWLTGFLLDRAACSLWNLLFSLSKLFWGSQPSSRLTNRASLASWGDAIEMPLRMYFTINKIGNHRSISASDNGKWRATAFRKTIAFRVVKCHLSLACGAVVSTAAAKYDLTNGCSADQARSARPHVDAMLKLEETSNSVRVDIIGNRGSTQGDRLSQDSL